MKDASVKHPIFKDWENYIKKNLDAKDYFELCHRAYSSYFHEEIAKAYCVDFLKSLGLINEFIISASAFVKYKEDLYEKGIGLYMSKEEIINEWKSYSENEKVDRSVRYYLFYDKSVINELARLVKSKLRSETPLIIFLKIYHKIDSEFDKELVFKSKFKQIKDGLLKIFKQKGYQGNFDDILKDFIFYLDERYSNLINSD